MANSCKDCRHDKGKCVGVSRSGSHLYCFEQKETTDIDAIVNSVLNEMGCDPKSPPHWIIYIHKTMDRTTGALIREIPNGYVCSRCGKHSWSKKEKCDGCNSIMQKEE